MAHKKQPSSYDQHHIVLPHSYTMNHLHSAPPESRKRRQAGAHLLDVPSEVLLEHLLPRLDVKDLLHLSGASKLLHRLCVSPHYSASSSSRQNDERTWGRLCLRDYHNANLPELLAAKTIPNKKLYAGLKHARVFVWGSTDHGRLGLDLNPPLGGRTWRYRRYIASPQELAIDGKAGRTWHQGLLGSLTRLAPVSSGGGPEDDQAPPPAIDPIPREELGSVVSLVAGLTSFAALTSTGKVIVWGEPALKRMKYARQAAAHLQVSLTVGCMASGRKTGRASSRRCPNRLSCLFPSKRCLSRWTALTSPF